MRTNDKIIDGREVNGTVLQLRRRKTDRDGKQYEYYVAEQGSKQRVGQIEYTRADGMRQLRETADAYGSADEAESRDDQGPTIPGMGGGGGGGGPSFGGGGGLPGLGMGKDEDDDDDEGGFRFF